MPFSVSVLVATSINAQASLCQTIWPSTFKDLESSLLAGYNITCKALGISAIIKGSRGKRDSKGFKAIVNSLKTLPFSVGLLEERGASRARVVGSNPTRRRAGRKTQVHQGGARSLKVYFATGCVG